MNAIIIAAGSAKRISKDVKDIPKSMVKVNGQPIIKYQLSALKQAGIDEIVVITGTSGTSRSVYDGWVTSQGDTITETPYWRAIVRYIR